MFWPVVEEHSKVKPFVSNLPLDSLGIMSCFKYFVCKYIILNNVSVNEFHNILNLPWRFSMVEILFVNKSNL